MKLYNTDVVISFVVCADNETNARRISKNTIRDFISYYEYDYTLGEIDNVVSAGKHACEIPWGESYFSEHPDMPIAEIFEEIDRREKETQEKQAYIDERQMNLFKDDQS